MSPVIIVAYQSEDIWFGLAFKMAENNIVVSKTKFLVWVMNYPRWKKSINQ